MGKAVVDCRGAHGAGDQTWPGQVSRVRVVQKLLYAEAVKKVGRSRGGRVA